jgi:hypothetical protein
MFTESETQLVVRLFCVRVKKSFLKNLEKIEIEIEIEIVFCCFSSESSDASMNRSTSVSQHKRICRELNQVSYSKPGPPTPGTKTINNFENDTLQAMSCVVKFRIN